MFLQLLKIYNLYGKTSRMAQFSVAVSVFPFVFSFLIICSAVVAAAASTAVSLSVCLVQKQVYSIRAPKWSTMPSLDKSPQIGIQRWRNKSVCFPPDHRSLPLLLWQPCLFHRPHYEPLGLGFFLTPQPQSLLSSPSLRLGLIFDCHLFFFAGLSAVTWLAGNYQPGDSSLFQELRGHQGFFFFFWCSFSGSAEVLWAGFSLWGGSSRR